MFIKINSQREKEICINCNGSGEGMHEGTRCQICKGPDSIKTSKVEALLADIYAEERADAMRDERNFY
ncbi:MAG: hypothetical protein P1P78_10035 [Methyloprofundus sp.]|nr:hypothetical protein [Methyloprofundus sp.]